MRRRQAGYSLPEVIIVMTLSIVVLGATLTTFTNFTKNQQKSQDLNQSIEQARNSFEILSRQLRNLARPSGDPFGATPSINRAQSYDVIFQTSAPTRTWVRYCMATTGTAGGKPVTANRGVVWEGVSPSSTITSGMMGACPGTGWATTSVVADNVVNQTAGQDRPLFSYTCPTAATCPGADLLKIKAVRSDLYVDLDVAKKPLEQRMSTAVFLRNQNEPPTAVATAKPGSPGTVLFNGSSTADPEERTLTYYWFVNSIPTGWACGQTPPDTATYLQGITATLTGATGTTKSVYLVACDPGLLGGTYGPMNVTFP
jgi:type II secretory pathway pseudopilin PulG